MRILPLVALVAFTGLSFPMPAFAQEPVAAAPANGAPMEYVRLTTNMGDIVLELDREKAPISVENFLSYVRKGHYDGTVFHRVIDGFMIQGGGFDADLNQKAVDAPIKNEWRNGLKNVRGSIAMARTQVHDSATSQFFINVVDNAMLDQPRDGAAYAVFGRVIGGMDVVDKIRVIKTENKGPAFANLPSQPVAVTQAKQVPTEEVADLVAAAAKAEQEKMEAIKEAATRSLSDGIELVKSKGVDVSGGSTSSSGLWHVDAKTGEGANPTATSTVKVHYTGWLTNGTKFDSSVDRGEPISFPLNRVIKGWTEGVSGMKPGGRRFLVIPSALGYGDRGAPPTIPPNATLVFEVELLAIEGS